MSVVLNIYKKNFLRRFDKDDAIPYLSHEDFKDLSCEKHSFTISDNLEIKYFIYNYPKYRDDKIVIFCHGIGPGHTAYFREIEYLCKSGYRVIALDYAGCGESEGEILSSINSPTRDVIELINHLKLSEEIVLIGHSLGGYTALNVINKTSFIHKAVIISGFLSTKYLVKGLVKMDILTDAVVKFEENNIPEYAFIDNISYLKNTDDKLLFIHSEDDPLVDIKNSFEIVKKMNNPNISFLLEKNKKHNPNYTFEAVDYMNKTIGLYTKYVAKGKLDTLEKRKEYFQDKSVWKMTEQDDKVWSIILDFIK